jgi:hypothetical protein
MYKNNFIFVVLFYTFCCEQESKRKEKGEKNPD